MIFLKKLKTYFPYITFIGLALFIGLISGIFTNKGMAAYELVSKPWFTPPSALFPIVWTILYILVGYSMGRVWMTKSEALPYCLMAYGAQLLGNLFWTIWFFLLQAYLFSFVWLVGLGFVVLIMAVLFFRADKRAGVLQVPYLLWLIFAGVLNLQIYLLN